MQEFIELRLDDGRNVDTGIERRGGGTPIVLLHAVGGNALWFASLITALNGRRVIALDMPGHGGSTGVSSWEMEPLAELIFASSRQLVNGPVIWGGHSWGGKLAAMIAARHPQTTEGLLLLDPSPACGTAVPAEVFVDMTYGGELGPWPSLDEAKSSVRKLPQYSGWNKELERAFERGLARGADGTVRARISRQTLIAISSGHLKDHSDAIRKVTCPALLAVADESLFWQEQTNFPLLPQATRAVIRSNHWLMTGNPAELNWVVDSWLAAAVERGQHEPKSASAR